MHGLDPASNRLVFRNTWIVFTHTIASPWPDLIQGIMAKASPFDATKRFVTPQW